MQTILYLHGFASSSNSQKAKIFKKYITKYDGYQILVPDLPNNLIEWTNEISYIIKNEAPSFLVGSSMGGFYSTYYAEQSNANAIVINPAVTPAEGMEVYLGKNVNYSTGEEFFLRSDEIEHLKKLQEEIVKPKDAKKFLVILESGDEVLDYKKAINYYKGGQIEIVFGGNHSLESFQDHLQTIGSFIGI